VSWPAHLGGLAGGLAGAWLLRDRRSRPAANGGGSPATSAHPRADLHKELGDLGLL
jgi:hypothetical protein